MTTSALSPHTGRTVRLRYVSMQDPTRRRMRRRRRGRRRRRRKRRGRKTRGRA